MKKFMNMLLSVSMGAVLLAASTFTYAQTTCGTTGCTGPASEVIEGLFPSPTGGILIQSTLATDAAACTGVNGNPTMTLPADHPNYKETYATLLTASVADKRVQLRIEDGVEPCTLFFTRMFN